MQFAADDASRATVAKLTREIGDLALIFVKLCTHYVRARQAPSRQQSRPIISQIITAAARGEIVFRNRIVVSTSP